MATLGKYELIKKLAVGGMAEVYLAQTVGPAGFSKTLVVKRILPFLAENPDFVTMFLNEARLAALLNHANIVQIFDLGEEAGTYYLAMELLDGPNLRDLNKGAFTSGERLPTGVALKVISLACEGLAFAHELVDPAGVPLRLVHRDISPHNILLSRSGNVKVSDFGIAKAASIPSITKTGKIKGKLKYMSPEQLNDLPLDLRSDVWAMGVTLYEVLTGSRPFEAPNEAGIIVGIMNHSPAPLAEHEVPEAALLQPIVDRALAKNRDQRYPDARALQADIENALLSLKRVVRGLEIADAIARFCPVDAPRIPSVPGMLAINPEATSTPRDPAVLAQRAAGPETGPVLTNMGPPEAGPVLTAMGPPEAGPVLTAMGLTEAGPALTNMGPLDGLVPDERLPVRRAIDRDSTAPQFLGTPAARPTGLIDVRPPAPPPLWSWVQRHPIAGGLVVGVLVVVMLFGAMVAQVRELNQKAAEQQRLTAPLPRRGPLAEVTEAPKEVETPVMDVASRPAVGERAEERAPRDAIDEPGALEVAKADALKAQAEGKAAAPLPKRHIGPQLIAYGFLELHVVPPCRVGIDRTDFGTTPLTVPLEPGSHRVSVDCAEPPHHERFNVVATAGVHQACKVDLRHGGTVGGALIAEHSGKGRHGDN